MKFLNVESLVRRQCPKGRARTIALGELSVETAIGLHTAEYWIRRITRCGTHWRIFEKIPGQRRCELTTLDSASLLDFLAGLGFERPMEWWSEHGLRDSNELNRYRALMCARDKDHS